MRVPAIIYRRRFAKDPLIRTCLLIITVISLYLWLQCSLNNNSATTTTTMTSSQHRRSLKKLAKLIGTSMPGFCVRCSADFEVITNVSSSCDIIEQDTKQWLFNFDKETLKLVPAWFRKWDEYVKFLPIFKVDLTSKKASLINTVKSSNEITVEIGDDIAYFRYLVNPGVTVTLLKNHTMPWRSDVESSLFERMSRYETPFQIGYLAESWHDNEVRGRFLAQNNWYRFLESGVKESDLIEKGSEKKAIKQWKRLIELTEWENYVEKLVETVTTFAYSVPFARSVRPLKRFLEKYRQFVENKRILVVGSTYPWLETEVFLKGARYVTTVTEAVDLKQTIPYNHPRLNYIHPRRMDKLLDGYDLVVTFSTLEHVGLGRYGDALNPDGDLMEMAKLSCLVKPGGLMLLSLPVDGDCLDFNYRRFYGPGRYSLMTECWRVVEFESFNVDDCKTRDWTYQPWFVLQNLRGCQFTLS